MREPKNLRYEYKKLTDDGDDAIMIDRDSSGAVDEPNPELVSTARSVLEAFGPTSLLSSHEP